MTRKYLSILIFCALIICAVVFGLSTNASAAEIVRSGSWGENVTYTLDSDGLLTIRGEGEMAPILKYSPFRGDKSIKKIVIEPGITSISDSFFMDCTELTDIVIPDSVTSIGYSVFHSCTGLTSITIPKGVTFMGGYMFYGCTALKSITIPEGVTSIGEKTFNGCTGLTSITIPKGVTSIGDDAFNGCTALTSVNIPDSVTSIGNNAFYECTGMTNVDLPDSVTSIGNWAFLGCSGLASATISASVTEIGEGAFYECTGLTKVTIQNGVTSIGERAFFNCACLKSLTIPDSVTSIGNWAFLGCSGIEKAEVTAGNTVYHSAGNCIIETDSKTLILGCNNSVIPDDGSVTLIGMNSFWRCTGLTEVTIPDSVTSIEMAAFAGCSGLTEVTIPGSVTYIGNSAFDSCSGLVRLNIHNGVSSIAREAFHGCSKLLSVKLPKSLTFIDISVFSYCAKLRTIKVDPNNKFYYSSGNCIIEKESKTVIAGCRNSVIPEDGSVTSIGHYAFFGCSGLLRLEIPDSVTQIWGNAFADCSSLRYLYIPDSVTSIGRNAFSGCSWLTWVSIPKSVTDIGDFAFKNCSKITLLVYDKSAAHYYAISENIRYIVRNEKTVSYEHDNKKYEAYFSPVLFYDSAVNSNNDLAMLAGLLSWEAENYDYDEKQNRKLYQEIGIDSDNIETGYAKKILKPSYCYTVCYKNMLVDGVDTNLLIVTTRGTITVSEGVDDALTYASSNFYDEERFDVYNSINSYADEVENGINDFINKHKELKNKPMKILFTGHSLGGATANLLGARYTYEVNNNLMPYKLSKDDIYVYTFGALDSISTKGTVDKGYENIHNIYNWRDSFGPNGRYGALVNHREGLFTGSEYGKFGHLDMFETQESTWFGTEAHNMPAYLDALRDGDVRYEDSNDQRYANICCPVDVKIYRDGELVGEVKDNEVVESVTVIPIAVVGDEKHILLQGYYDYTFEIAATDGGTMEYSVGDAGTGKTLQKFENVVLEKGKTLQSAVPEDAGPEDIKLIVVDPSGQPVAEVNDDGTETEIKPAYIPGDVDGNGQILADDARLALRASAKLETLDEIQKKAADVDGSGDVLADDARQILRFSAKLQHEFVKK